MVKIYDAHNHWLPPEIAQKTTFFKTGWSDINALLSALDEAEIEKAILLYPTSDAHIAMGGWSKLCTVYNDEIAKIVKKYPDRLAGCGILPIDTPPGLIDEVKRIKDLGLCGLSLASSYNGKYLDDRMFLPVLKEAEKKKLTIFVHSQIIDPIGIERVKDPLLMPVIEYLFDVTMCAGKLMMEESLSQFKDLKIVFSHFAGVLPFLSDRFDSTYAMLRKRNIVKDLGQMPTDILKKFYVDTSGVKSERVLQTALDFFGPEKMLWGSDFPAKKNLTESIEAVRDLNIDSTLKEKILGDNAANLINQGA